MFLRSVFDIHTTISVGHDHVLIRLLLMDSIRNLAINCSKLMLYFFLSVADVERRHLRRLQPIDRRRCLSFLRRNCAYWTLALSTNAVFLCKHNTWSQLTQHELKRQRQLATYPNIAFQHAQTSSVERVDINLDFAVLIRELRDWDSLRDDLKYSVDLVLWEQPDVST